MLRLAHIKSPETRPATYVHFKILFILKHFVCIFLFHYHWYHHHVLRFIERFIACRPFSNYFSYIISSNFHVYTIANLIYNRLNHSPPKTHANPTPWNLQILLSMAIKNFAGVIGLQIMRWEDYLGLSEWGLNALTCILWEGGRRRLDARKKRRRQCNHDGRHRSDVATSQERCTNRCWMR